MAMLAISTVQANEYKKVPIERLKYGLCLTFWEPKIWGWDERTKIEPVKIARRIHENLISKVEKAQRCNKVIDYIKIGKSLNKDYDAVIVHQCTILEQRKRKTGTCGTIWARGLVGIPIRFDAEPFCQNACSFDGFYQSLTDSELEQLRKGTAPRGFFSRLLGS